MNRRRWLAGLGASLGRRVARGLRRAVVKAPVATKTLSVAEGFNRRVQRLSVGRTGAGSRNHPL